MTPGRNFPDEIKYILEILPYADFFDHVFPERLGEILRPNPDNKERGAGRCRQRKP